MKKEPQIEKILNSLSVEEKASLTGGANSTDLNGLPEHGIPVRAHIGTPSGECLMNQPL